MKPSDRICDICGKQKGRPNNHTICSIKRTAKLQRQAQLLKEKADVGILRPAT